MLALFAVLLLGQVAQTPPDAQELLRQNKTIRINRVSHPPKLDDFLGGKIPEGQVGIADFRQQKPADGAPVSRETTAYISYDDQNLYAVFLCKDVPANVRGRMSKRDDIFSDDEVGLYLDTFLDHQHALSFYVNPLGIQSDSVNTEGQGDDFSYDIVWKSEGRLTADGYAVLLAIPFKSIRFPNADVQRWGFGVARFVPSNNESSYWPYYTSRIDGFAPQLGILEGISTISSGRNMQLVPYATYEDSRFLNIPDAGNPSFQTQSEFRAGVDSKIIIHDSITLDTTINPDFSQVESDSPQVTADQRYEVYFPEKRPFFLENANYFQTPENLFFSRRIQDPEFGGRLTGTAGHWILGLLGMDDRFPGNQFAPADPLFDKHAVIGAARIQRQLGQQSTIGMLATHYGLGPNRESLFSMDTRLKLNPHLVTSAQAVHSQTASSTGQTSGKDYYADLVYTSLHLNSTTKYIDRSPGFDSELGFIQRVDIRQVQEDASYRWLPAERILKSFGPSLTLSRDWNHERQLQDWLANANFSVELTGSTTFTAGRIESLEVYQNLNFEKHANWYSIGTDVLKQVGLQATYNSGSRVNYYPAGTLLPFGANGRDITVDITLRPSARMKFDQLYLFSQLQSLNGHPAILNDHLMRETFNYQFTKALSARTILDYDAALPNASLISLDRSKQLTADFLLTYLVNPGTALYIGYTDQRQNLALLAGTPGNPPVVQTIANPGTNTGRQLFIKLSYLFRF